MFTRDMRGKRRADAARRIERGVKQAQSFFLGVEARREGISDVGAERIHDWNLHDVSERTIEHRRAL